MSFDRPKFITFEGGEGSGKTTQSKMLHEYLISKRIKAIRTREVGGTVEAEKIRHILVYSELYPMSELMLVMAARYEHINKVIIPALQDGSWVICDRFVDSTACYQSEGSGLTMDEIYELHRRLMKVKGYNPVGIMPDLTFFMDVPPKTGLSRAAARSDTDKFEEKNMDFHEKIYQRFQQIAAMDQDRIVKVACEDLTIEEIHQKIIDSVF